MNVVLCIYGKGQADADMASKLLLHKCHLVKCHYLHAQTQQFLKKKKKNPSNQT